MRSWLLVLLTIIVMPAAAQNVETQRKPVQVSPGQEFLTNLPANLPTSAPGAEYRVGRDDLIEVAVFEAPDLGGAGRVSAAGVVSLPLIGPVQAAGMTTQEIEKEVAGVLKKSYANDP